MAKSMGFIYSSKCQWKVVKYCNSVCFWRSRSHALRCKPDRLEKVKEVDIITDYQTAGHKKLKFGRRANENLISIYSRTEKDKRIDLMADCMKLKLTQLVANPCSLRQLLG